MKMTSLIGMAAALAALISVEAGADIIPATDSNIQYLGRFNTAIASTPEFDWPGTSVKAKFQGTSVGVILNNGGATYRFRAFIDGTPVSDIVASTSGSQTYTVASGLADGEHTVEISKKNEEDWGIPTTKFEGFVLGSGKTLVAPDTAPSRKILVIGDSFTVGYGASYVGAAKSGTHTEKLQYDDNYISYGRQLARHYGASAQVIARSGYGVYCKNDNISPSDSMRNRINQTIFANSGISYTYANFVPQLVIISLGINDFATWAKSEIPTQEQFETAYTELITNLKSHYPSAKFLLCTFGSTQTWHSYVQNVAVANSCTYATKSLASGELGLDWHPNLAGHTTLANHLKTAIDGMGVQWPLVNPSPLTMAVSPSGAGTTSPAVGMRNVEQDEATSIVATPSAGKSFSSWTVTAGNATIGSASSASTTATLTDSSGATVQANFIEASRTLRNPSFLNDSNGGTGTDDGAQYWTRENNGAQRKNWSSQDGDGWSGIMQNWSSTPNTSWSQTLAASPGSTCSAGAYFMRGSGYTASAIQIKLEFYDSNWTELGENFTDTGAVGTSWRKFDVEGTAPAQTSAVKVSVLAQGQGTSAGLYVDNLSYSEELASTATLNISSSPSSSGTTIPASGAYSVSISSPTAISATPSSGYRFTSWTKLSGNATIASTESANTTVSVLDAAGASISANFAGKLRILGAEPALSPGSTAHVSLRYFNDAGDSKYIVVNLMNPNGWTWQGGAQTLVPPGTGTVEIQFSVLASATLGQQHLVQAYMDASAGNWENPFARAADFPVAMTSSPDQNIVFSSPIREEIGADDNFTFHISYSATGDKEIQIDIFNSSNQWLAHFRQAVTAGIGKISDASISLPGKTPGRYKMSAYIANLGQNWENADDFSPEAYVTVGSSPDCLIAFASSAGGSISGSKTQVIPSGSDSSPVEAVAQNGWHFIGWSGDFVGTENPLTLDNVVSDMDITANFTRTSPNDFDGDGMSDVICESPVENGFVYFMNGITASPATSVYDKADKNWIVANFADFNGDGKTDMLWQHEISGQVLVYLMNGASILSARSIYKGGEWKVEDCADFDGDGKDDLLWSHSQSGSSAIYLMNGADVSSTHSLKAGFGWLVRKAADFNGDGKSDILWEINGVQGNLYLMNGATVSSEATIYSKSPVWNLKLFGDFNGDSKTDILWESTDGKFGYVYLMNGTALLPESGISYTKSDLAWKIVNGADYNGDGKTDILWEHELEGLGAIHLMNGKTPSSSAVVYTLKDVNPSRKWIVADTLDFNGDGKYDMLWENAETRKTLVYLMNGLSLISSGSVYKNGAGWNLIAL